MTEASQQAQSPTTDLPRCRFRKAAILLMLIGVVLAFIQKGRESAVAATVARQMAAGVGRTEESQRKVENILQEAHCWATASHAVALLAIVLWLVALTRREKYPGAGAIFVSLLALYVGLELLMV